jgi:O-antigen ligase
LILTWVILFPYQNELDPRQADNLDLSDIAAAAGAGNLLHQALAVLLGSLGIVCLFKYGGNLRLRGVVGRILLIYVTWIAVSVIWSDDPGVTLRRQAAFGLMLAFCAGCAARMTKDNLSRFIAGLTSLNLAAAIVQEFIRGTLHPFAAGNRFSGTISPNTQGAGLAVAVVISFWFAWGSGGSSRRYSISAGIVLLFFLFLTGSRTSLVGLIAAMIASVSIIGIRRYRGGPYRIGAVLMLGLALITGAALLYASDTRPMDVTGMTNVLRTERDGDEVTDLTGRTQIWDVTGGYAAARPVLGYGYGGFWTGGRLDAVADELKWPAYHSHSAYLDMILQVGGLGAIVYIVLLVTSIVVCIVKFLRFEDSAGVFAAILVFMTINGLTESIVILPTFPALILNLVLMKLALASPA